MNEIPTFQDFSLGITAPPMVSILVDMNFQCRICLRLAEGGMEVNSFFELLQKDFKLFELFGSVFSIKGNEAFPKMVCDSCASTIMKFESLLVTFRETEDYLEARPNELNYTEEIIIREENPLTTSPEENNKNTNKVIDETDTELLFESVKYSCTNCHDVFLQQWPFMQHMSIKHGLDLEKDQTMLFSSKVTMNIPKSTPEIALQPQHKCSICPKTFQTDLLRTEHLKTHKKFACADCDASFMKKDHLNSHLAKHSTEPRFICNICNKSLKYRSALARHKRGHLNIREHICETCGMNFKENYTLLTHKRLKHSDERKYPCSACGTSFKVKSLRDRHFKKKHTEEAIEYFCNICRVSYKYQSSLTRHNSEKHSMNNNHYSCEVCSKTYSNKHNLKRHVKVHGSKERESEEKK